MQAIVTGFAGHGNGVKKGTFKKQVTGIGCIHTAVFTTHDTSNGQRTLVVGNHQSIAAELDLLAIQQGQGLVLLRHAYTDTTTHLRQVKGVHRLAQFQHYIVGDIHRWVDAAHTAALKAGHHPVGGRAAQVNIADNATHIAGASLRRLQLNRNGLLMAGRNIANFRIADRHVVKRTHFARQTGQRQAIATVGGQIHLDGNIIQIQVFTHTLAQRCIRRQLHDAAVVVADFQLVR